MTDGYRVGIVGARGHTGRELVAILARHPSIEVVFAGSRELEGQPVPSIDGLRFEALGPEDMRERDVDAVFLALPNGLSQDYVSAVTEQTVIVDISADHRFDDSWVYGLPELGREKISGARRIANPGCYATVMQLALHPFVDRLEGTPAVFGVSGYSGAGTTPSPRNDPETLADNLVPYKLVDHIHEREAIRNLGVPVRFMPHVHPAFRGLLATIHVPVNAPISGDEARRIVEERYVGERLIEVIDDIPDLRSGAGRLGVLLGGIHVGTDDRSVVVVGAEDNLLKGAAVQAVQNLNLALGLPELSGIT